MSGKQQGEADCGRDELADMSTAEALRAPQGAREGEGEG